MIHLATRDEQADVVRIFAHPDVFPHMDAGCELHELERRIDESWCKFSYWLTEGNEGFFQVEPMRVRTSVMIHAAAYPEVRGRAMLRAWRELVVCLAGAGIERAYSWTPRPNDRAWMFALLCGGTPCDPPNENPHDYYGWRGNWQRVDVKEAVWAVR